MDARELVLDAVARISRRDRAGLGDGTRLAEDLGIRSIQRIELAAVLEDAAGKDLGPTAVLKARTVGDLVSLVT